MTIITTQSRITYAGDNISTLFPIPFEFFLNTDITAVKTAAGGAVSTLVQGVDYTLAGAGVIGGGSATKTTALLSGETLALFLNPPIEQESHYQSNSPFPAATLENDLDRQTQISQRLQDQISRAIRAPDSDANVGSFLLPSALNRANTVVAFDSNGNLSLATAIPSGTLSRASIGALENPQTPAEGLAGITPNDKSYKPGDPRRYTGWVGDGVTPDSTAWASAVAQNLQPGGSAVYVPPLTSVAQIVLTGNLAGLRFYGDGMTRSVIKAISGSDDVFVFQPGSTALACVFENFQVLGSAVGTTLVLFSVAPTGTSTALASNWTLRGGVWKVTFSDGQERNVTLTQGAATATWTGALTGAPTTAAATGGNGFNFQQGMNPSQNVNIRNVFCYGHGNSGILDTAGLFCSEIASCIIDHCYGHLYDLLGDNTLSFRQTYAETTLTSGKAGYRVHGGSPTFYTVNGVNSADFWGIYSDNVAQDGIAQFCHPVWVDCNIEGFSVTGTRNKQGGGTALGRTNWLAHVTGTKACDFSPTNVTNCGTLDNDSAFFTTSGTFLNGCAVHITGNSGLPFTVINSPAGNAQFQYYDEVQGLAVSMSTTRAPLTIATNRYANTFFDVRSDGAAKLTQLLKTSFVQAYSAAITINWSQGTTARITANNGTAFTINAPTNYLPDQEVTIWISNTSGGALGAVTFNAQFHLAGAWVSPATGFNRSITFRYDLTANVFYEISRTAADTAN